MGDWEEVWGVTMVKDEADVIRPILEHMLDEELDGIIVADNLSTDGTSDILHDMAKARNRIFITTDSEVGYYQSAKMTALAERAFELGARWVIPFDADEWWRVMGSSNQTLAGYLQQVPSDWIGVKLYNHHCTAKDDPDILNPFKRMGWRAPRALPLSKIAFRADRTKFTIEQGNHEVIFHQYAPVQFNYPVEIEIRHFQVRSAEHFIRKAINGGKAYEAADLPLAYGRHWRDYYNLYNAGGREALAKVFWEHWYYREPEGCLVYDPVAEWGES